MKTTQQKQQLTRAAVTRKKAYKEILKQFKELKIFNDESKSSI